jgi:hypothetical protein
LITAIAGTRGENENKKYSCFLCQGWNTVVENPSNYTKVWGSRPVIVGTRGENYDKIFYFLGQL